MVRERALQQRILLSLDVDPEVGLLDADRLRFRQVVLNLLSNAVKFTPEGGRVDVRASIRGQDLVVLVTDTGVGVQAEDRERIFDSFQQGARILRAGRGNRARAHPVQADPRAAWGQDLGGKRSREGQHVRDRAARRIRGTGGDVSRRRPAWIRVSP